VRNNTHDGLRYRSLDQLLAAAKRPTGYSPVPNPSRIANFDSNNQNFGCQILGKFKLSGRSLTA